METITNAATAVTSTVSGLIYGQPAKEGETNTNETGGKEPLSGAQGKGTVNEPFDKGNAGERTRQHAISKIVLIMACRDPWSRHRFKHQTGR